MKRREFLGRAGAGVAAAIVAQGARAEGAPRRPNVIFAFSDEHRWHSMTQTELPQVHTPNMQRLAAQGTSLTNCISNYPVCSPYRAMLMTGRWPWQTGVDDNSVPLKDSEQTIGKAFRDAGYATAYIGKWHLGGTRAEPFGFDHSLLWTNDNIHWDKSLYHPKDGGPMQPKGYNATLMTDQALEYIEAHQKDPFFMVLSWNPPHAVFTDAPEEKKALYTKENLPRRANVPSGDDAEKDGAFGYGWENYQGYHAHITAIDDELGRLMDALDRLGLAEDTILIYSSDHGSMMGSQGLGGKRQPYEESIRVPFIVRWPGHATAGRAVDALVGTIDLFPTLCGLTGVSVPGTCMGSDCSAWLRGGDGPRQDAQIIMHLNKQGASGGENHPAPLFRGIRTEQHTYAVREGKPWLLFDVKSDPLERANLCGQPVHAELQAKLHARAEEMFKEAGSALA